MLVKEKIPDGAIAVLGKGLSFTPTPTINIQEEQLSMRLATNNILRTADKPPENHSNIKSSIPSKLSHKSYVTALPAKEAAVNAIVSNVTEQHNGRLQFENISSGKKNLSKNEQEGLQWLMRETKNGNIAVVKADKGGALLIVKPKLLEDAVMEKLENPNL